MSIVEKLRPLSEAEYLALEEKSDVRHEYVNGYIYAMVGESVLHNQIVVDLLNTIYNHLKADNKPCRAFVNGVKVRLKQNSDTSFRYPDIFVSCDQQFTANSYYDEHPKLIFEVLSPSTEHIDRFEKRLDYQRFQSLEEYGLVAQNRMAVEIYRRTKDSWELEKCASGDTVRFTSIDLHLPIEELYSGVMDFGVHKKR